MSRIVFHNSVSEQPAYKLALQQKITEVCRAIGFDDSDITWTIFDNKDFYLRKHAVSYGWTLEELFAVNRGADYGYCYPARNEIWVSILALQQVAYTPRNMPTGLASPLYKNDILADILIDEITHIQTRRDHDDICYEIKLKENKSKYYD